MLKPKGGWQKVKEAGEKKKKQEIELKSNNSMFRYLIKENIANQGLLQAKKDVRRK